MGPERPPIVFYAFDLLQLNGKDFRLLPIEERKAKLEAYVDKACFQNKWKAAERRNQPRQEAH